MAIFIVKLVETEKELESAIQIRFRVFVSEQGVPVEEELDEGDANAIHVIALVGEQIVGTSRLLNLDGLTAQIGRMAVDAAWRRKGIGSRLLRFLEGTARADGMRNAVIHAQEYIKNFYAAHGYCEYGEPFMEAAIPHIEMRKDL